MRKREIEWCGGWEGGGGRVQGVDEEEIGASMVVLGRLDGGEASDVGTSGEAFRLFVVVEVEVAMGPVSPSVKVETSGEAFRSFVMVEVGVGPVSSSVRVAGGEGGIASCLTTPRRKPGLPE